MTGEFKCLNRVVSFKIKIYKLAFLLFLEQVIHLTCDGRYVFGLIRLH